MILEWSRQSGTWTFEIVFKSSITFPFVPLELHKNNNIVFAFFLNGVSYWEWKSGRETRIRERWNELLTFRKIFSRSRRCWQDSVQKTGRIKFVTSATAETCFISPFIIIFFFHVFIGKLGAFLSEGRNNGRDEHNRFPGWCSSSPLSPAPPRNPRVIFIFSTFYFSRQYSNREITVDEVLHEKTWPLALTKVIGNSAFLATSLYACGAKFLSTWHKYFRTEVHK